MAGQAAGILGRRQRSCRSRASGRKPPGLLRPAAACSAARPGPRRSALITMARGTLVIMTIDQGSSLAALTTATADLDTVAYEMTMLAEEAGGIFAPPAG